MVVFTEEISSGEVKKEAEDSLEVKLENERDDDADDEGVRQGMADELGAVPDADFG